MESRTWQWIGTVVVGVLVAVVAFWGLLRYQHLTQDEENLHAVVQMLNYNVSQGKLLALPMPATQPAPAAAVPPAPTPSPEAPKK